MFAGLLALAGIARADSLPKDSPFVPPAGTAAAAPAADAGYAFTGMTQLGRDTLLGFARLSDKRSVWVPLGKTVGDLTAVAYDAKTDTATIQVDGKVLTLTMRHGSVASAGAAAAPAPAPAAPALQSEPVAIVPAPPPASTVPAPASSTPPAPPPPLTTADKETEARMLVTDLLEIGLQQRLAYEEAQRRANEREATGKAPPADAVTTPVR